MTNAIATVTPERAWLSMDHSLVDRRDGSRMADIEKVVTLPERKMITGAVGAFRGMVVWQELWKHFPDGQLPDPLEDMADYLREFPKHDLTDGQFYAFALGWSDAKERVMGYVFDQATNFEPQELEGTTFTPAPSDKGPFADRIPRMLDEAEKGENVGPCHAALHENMRWTVRRGHRAMATDLSETYTTAMVSAEGALDLGHFNSRGRVEWRDIPAHRLMEEA